VARDSNDAELLVHMHRLEMTMKAIWYKLEAIEARLERAEIGDPQKPEPQDNGG
jgi:hypothetical protein